MGMSISSLVFCRHVNFVYNACIICYIVYHVSMYVATVPNRNSPPAILLRESFRLAGEVKTRTIANISHLPAPQVEALRLALKGVLPFAATSLPDSFLISRSRPHGHVAAVLGSLRKVQLD